LRRDAWRNPGNRYAVFGACSLVCIYAAVCSGHFVSPDGRYMFTQARSLFVEHSLTFPISPSGPISTSRWGIGLSLVYLPGLALWSTVVSPLPATHLDKDLVAYTIFGTPVHMLIAALSAYFVARLLQLLGCSRRLSLVAMALYGVGSPALVYARGDFAQPLEGLCWIAALYLGLKYVRDRGKMTMAACCIALTYAVLTRPVEGVLLMPAIIAVLMPPSVPSWRSRVAYLPAISSVAATGAGVLLTIAVNWGRFGSPWTTGYGDEHWTAPLLDGLRGVLISPARGLLWEFPLALFVPLGAHALWARGHRSCAIALGYLSLAQLVNVAMWDQWWGGSDWGLRLFVPALPVVTVAGVAALTRVSPMHRKPLALVFGACGLIWAIPCIGDDLNTDYLGGPMTPAANFALHTYPPLSQWQFLKPGHGVDIIWFRLANSVSPTLLLVPVLLLILAGRFWLNAVAAAGEPL
jgi:hypothetical protein